MCKPNYIAAYIIDPNATPMPLILLLQRSSQVHFPGIWQMVTGKVDKGHTVLQTVKKEILEETGLDIDKAYSVNITSFYEKVKDQIGFSANFLVHADHRQKVILNPKEHSEYQWVPIDKAMNLLAFSTQKETLNHIEQYYVKKVPNNAFLTML